MTSERHVDYCEFTKCNRRKRKWDLDETAKNKEETDTKEEKIDERESDDKKDLKIEEYHNEKDQENVKEKDLKENHNEKDLKESHNEKDLIENQNEKDLKENHNEKDLENVKVKDLENVKEKDQENVKEKEIQSLKALEAAAKISAALASKVSSTAAKTTEEQPPKSGALTALTASASVSLTAALGLDAETPKPQAARLTLATAKHHKRIDINDSRHRYYLTKESTKTEMEAELGVTIAAVGKYFPNRSMATEREPPLALDILAMEEEPLRVALERIQQIAEHGPATTSPNPSGRTAKVFMPGLEADPLPTNIFSIRGKILGPQGSFVKHIQTQSNCKVQLRGRGSGYVDVGAQEESLEPMHLFISGTRDEDVELAKQLATDLMQTVHADINKPVPVPVVPPIYQYPYGYYNPYGYYQMNPQNLVNPQVNPQSSVANPAQQVAQQMPYPLQTPYPQVPYPLQTPYPQGPHPQQSSQFPQQQQQQQQQKQQYYYPNAPPNPPTTEPVNYNAVPPPPGLYKS